MVKKLILGGLIFSVAMMAGIPAGWCGSYPTGQATVTKITPFNGVAKYYGLGQQYVNEYAAGEFGVAMANGSIATRGTIGAVKSTGQARMLSSITTLPKAASASIAGIAIQAGLMIGAYYLDQYLEEMEWGYEDGHGYYDTNAPGELPENCPEGGTVCWDGQPLNYGATVGTMYGPGPGNPPTAYSVVEGLFANYSQARAACASCTSIATYYLTGWQGFGSIAYQSGSGTAEDPLVRHYYYYAQDAQPHLVPINEMMGLPPPLTSEEIAASIQATLDAHTPPDSHAVWNVAQGSLAQVAPYVNESNQDFPTNRDSGPMGNLTIENMGDIQDALDSGIDPGDAEQVEDQNATKTGETDWEYTPQELAKAQYDYNKQLDQERKVDYDSYENAEPGYNATMVTPEKASITEKLDTFKESLETGGMLQALGALSEVEVTSASCALQADLGDWGILEFSFCEWSDPVEALGVVMLSFCTFLWTVWFFMGRGDA